MATLEEVHNIQVEMLSDLDEFCKKIGISYTMIGGTMLGAIRHQGFIPWDDDIDIAMSMGDFDELVRNYSSEKFFIQTPATDIEMPFVMYKMRLNGSIMPEPEMETLNMHQGIWIDIFVYTNAGKTDSLKNIQSWLYKLLATYRCKYLNKNANQDRKMHEFFTRIPKSMQLFLDKLILGLIRVCGSKKSNEYFMLDPGKYRIYPKKYLDNHERYLFEEQNINGVKDADEYLTWVYGEDYMIPRKWSHLPDCSNVVIKKEEE